MVATTTVPSSVSGRSRWASSSVPASNWSEVYRSFMMWSGPGCWTVSWLRFQWTTCQPPVPSPSSTAVVLTTTRSPTATVPVSSVKQ